MSYDHETLDGVLTYHQSVARDAGLTADENTFARWRAFWQMLADLAETPPPPPPPDDVTPGLPVGWEPQRTIAGSYAIGRDEVLTDVQITGTLHRGAGGALHRCHIVGGVRDFGGPVTVLRECEVGEKGRRCGDDGIYANSIDAAGLLVQGFSDALKIEAGQTFRDAEFRVWRAEGDHNDAAQAYMASAGVASFTRCTFDTRPVNVPSEHGNAAIFVADESPVTLVLDDCRLIGGNYTLQLLDGRDHRLRNVVIEADSWNYGPVRVKAPATIAEWDVRLSTGEPLHY